VLLILRNSTLITGDVVASLQTLQNSEGPDLLVYGSSNLVQTLFIKTVGKDKLRKFAEIDTFPNVYQLEEGKELSGKWAAHSVCFVYVYY
jgi:hypothetical protein